MSFLDRYEGGNLKRSASNEWKIEGIPGLLISNGMFNHTMEGYGGKTALDWLVKVRGMEFKEAVRQLAGDEVTPTAQRAAPQPSPRKKDPKVYFQLPTASENNEVAISYLESRSIDRAIIQTCIDNGSLYQSAPDNRRINWIDEEGEITPAFKTIKKNGESREMPWREVIKTSCIFVGRDENNHPAYASQRQVDGDFKGDIAGSKKAHGFCLPANDPASQSLAVFEAPIEALSHATLSKHLNSQIDAHRLFLGGVFSLALKQFLENNESIKTIYLCLNNDEAGQTAMKRIAEELAFNDKYQGIKIVPWPPSQGNDYNQMLTTLYPAYTVPEQAQTREQPQTVQPQTPKQPNIQPSKDTRTAEPSKSDRPQPTKTRTETKAKKPAVPSL